MRTKVMMAATYALLGSATIVMLIPLVYLACSAVKSSEDMFASTFLPAGNGIFGIGWDKLTMRNFAKLLFEFDFIRHIVNSAFISSTTGVLAGLFSAMGGYALAKLNFKGRELLTNLALIALVIPPVLLLAPTYKLLYWLGLLNTYYGLILPAIAPAFGIYLFRQAIINSVPTELIESARIDGCGELRVFFTIVLPLIRPMIGAFILITYLGVWNNFIGPQIVLQSPEKFPLSVAIAQLKGVYSQDYGLQMAATLVSIIPVLCLFLLLQKEFISGLVSGAVKG